MSNTEEQSNKRTPFGAKIPQATINAVIPVVKTLADFGTAATAPRIANLAGTSPASSGFKTKLAAAGYYGLIARDGDLRTVTERGESIASDDAKRVLTAKREAVMSTNLGLLLHAFRGRVVNENILAGRLQSDFGVPETSASYIAKALIETATQAELINTSNQFDAGAIEEFAHLRPQSTSPSSSNGDTATPASTKPKALRNVATHERPKVAESKPPKEPPPFNSGLQVVVKIDASSLTPKQIAELIRELQKPPTA